MTVWNKNGHLRKECDGADDRADNHINVKSGENNYTGRLVKAFLTPHEQINAN